MIAADEDDDVGGEVPASAPIRRSPNAKMRRAYDDLDADIYRAKRARRHRRQRFVRALRKLAGLCASCGGPLPKDPGAGRAPDVTCARCLSVDKNYKVSSREVEGAARYVDELARPMRLKFTPKMLPVVGPRFDGSAPDWPACENLSDCMTELVRACGAKEAPGASCPSTCRYFKITAS